MSTEPSPKSYSYAGAGVSIALPWPRAYEVKLSFKIDVGLASLSRADFDMTRFPILPLGGG